MVLINQSINQSINQLISIKILRMLLAVEMAFPSGFLKAEHAYCGRFQKGPRRRETKRLGRSALLEKDWDSLEEVPGHPA